MGHSKTFTSTAPPLNVAAPVTNTAHCASPISTTVAELDANISNSKLTTGTLSAGTDMGKWHCSLISTYI